MKKLLDIIWAIFIARREPKLQEVKVECRRF
jgi:hypothetical protein